MSYINTACLALPKNPFFPPPHLRRVPRIDHPPNPAAIEARETEKMVKHVENKLADFVCYTEFVQDFTDTLKYLIKFLIQEFMLYSTIILDPHYRGEEHEDYRKELTIRILASIADGKRQVDELLEGKKPKRVE